MYIYVYMIQKNMQSTPHISLALSPNIYIYIYIERERGGKRDSDCTKMLRTILNKFSKQHATKQQLYGHLPLISKTIQLNEQDMQDTAEEARTKS